MNNINFSSGDTSHHTSKKPLVFALYKLQSAPLFNLVQSYLAPQTCDVEIVQLLDGEHLPNDCNALFLIGDEEKSSCGHPCDHSNHQSCSLYTHSLLDLIQEADAALVPLVSIAKNRTPSAISNILQGSAPCETQVVSYLVQTPNACRATLSQYFARYHAPYQAQLVRAYPWFKQALAHEIVHRHRRNITDIASTHSLLHPFLPKILRLGDMPRMIAEEFKLLHELSRLYPKPTQAHNCIHSQTVVGNCTNSSTGESLQSVSSDVDTDPNTDVRAHVGASATADADHKVYNAAALICLGFISRSVARSLTRRLPLLSPVIKPCIAYGAVTLMGHGYVILHSSDVVKRVVDALQRNQRTALHSTGAQETIHTGKCPSSQHSYQIHGGFVLDDHLQNLRADNAPAPISCASSVYPIIFSSHIHKTEDNNVWSSDRHHQGKEHYIEIKSS
ncbi:hypothetical protein [Fannyhessea vaginae]|uniref:hypothetical protein n=1 Tax=Fannyhessea vaginae TaxID=82135 RepID=UPI002889FA91|nr:hypothetical protein [Fannyhessea vaginae]